MEAKALSLAYAGKGQRQMVLALISTVFVQETQEAAISQWRAVADQQPESASREGVVCGLPRIVGRFGTTT